MVLGAAYVGRMMRTWSVCDSSGGFICSHLKKQYLTVGTPRAEQRSFSCWLQILLKNTTVGEMKEKAFRGTRNEKSNRDSLTDLPFTPSCYTSPQKNPVIMEAWCDF